MLNIGTSCDAIVSLHQYQIITEGSTGGSLLKCVLDLYVLFYLFIKKKMFCGFYVSMNVLFRCLGNTLADRLASQPIVTEHFARSITTQIVSLLLFFKKKGYNVHFIMVFFFYYIM
jgi:nitrate/nitrite transporter NarK